MIDKNVLEYIKAETSKGVSRETIASSLMQHGGWTSADIDAHFAALEKADAAAPSAAEPPTKKEKTFFQKFLYAMGQILLVMIVIAVIGFGLCILVLSTANF